ncbi:MAG TPA: RDD family protein [Solirubrobacterales bacterium]|nr:RDD family protein [Solirubrobacterales bacterium]
MENGSTPPSAGTGDASQNGHLPLSARLLGVGVQGARAVGKATGIDRAVEVAAEEAIVAAVESEAVERAMARVLQGPIVEEAVQGALESDAVKKALLEAMDSELVDEVWRRLLASEEAQQLVERIAEAPEVRAAISAQGVGLLEDIGRTIGKVARRLDDSFERIVRRLFFRRRRAVASDHAGAVSRALAMVIDGVFVNLTFTAIAAVVALIESSFGDGSSGGVSNLAIAVGSTAWLSLGALYLVAFWSLAGQTPGMRFVGIRLNEQRLPLRRSIKRLIGLGLSVITFGIGFLGIVFGERRRDWADSFGGTDVVYDDRRPEPAPWSRLEQRPAGAEPVVAEAEPIAGPAPADAQTAPSGPSASL